MKQEPITITATINAPIEKVWEYWNEPRHIEGWAFASDDWMASNATNDLAVGGKFKTTMSAKDPPSASSGQESVSFDFEGVYTRVEELKAIEYDMEKAPDEKSARHVKVEFENTPDGVKITETFDPENENPLEMQKDGWQSILNNFKKYTERR